MNNPPNNNYISDHHDDDYDSSIGIHQTQYYMSFVHCYSLLTVNDHLDVQDPKELVDSLLIHEKLK